jgi:hypothetical protein
LVLVPSNTSDVEGAVEALLAPYNEDIEVAPYLTECWCVGQEAESADTDCKECQGTGTRITTHNPSSKWDWWQIGGRWTGALVPDYNPEEDPENIETCNLCHGTGKRDDKLGQQFRKENPNFTCNGCAGKGERLKWPSLWRKFEGDIMPVSQVPKDFVPFALVEPNGLWHEKGKMGWFGMVTNRKDDDKWEAIVRDLLTKHNDCIAVVVDCHI